MSEPQTSSRREWVDALRRPKVQLAILCLLCAVALTAFANKAIHIDDTMFLWTARQIIHHPLDFYGFDVNWEGTAQPMAAVMKNPPLVSYYQAAIAAVAGFHEIALHLAFIPFALASLVFTYLLARRMNATPVFAALALLVSPAFFVSSTTLMADVMMLSLWLAAMWLWLSGVQDDRPALLPLAGLFITAAVLTKYPALNLIPLLAAYALFDRRRLAIQLLSLAIPLVALAAYECLSHHWYGQGLLLGAGQFATAYRTDRSAGTLINLLTGLAFTGGGTLCAAIALVVLGSRRFLVLVTACFAILLLIFSAMPAFGTSSIRTPSGRDMAFVVQLAAMCILGAVICAAALTDWLRLRDRDSLLLLLWIWGVFVFLSIINWTANARTMLPLAPAAAILAARHLSRRNATDDAARPLLSQWRRRALAAAVVFAAVVTTSVAMMDYRLAAAFRDAAQIVRDRSQQISGRIWFAGHWGFQWYAEQFAAPIDAFQTRFSPGDLIVMTLQTSNPDRLPPQAVALVDRLEMPVSPLGSTLSDRLHAGFYASRFGPLPYAFGTSAPQVIEVYRVIRPILPATKPSSQP